ncbi:hypothetical protein T440DRAFT_148248 [Plenodomus tracheiphilus IPT5]|uniref:Uncharacterized protein n=1 Tax=Plenodomus tracheiphilus IPT5 TaxID=1408161 RepID=A0A6A7B344_9PLEO|nr:hypothetical protein T440DRAFT_148248 [Plenodomus tracheiphilus IPT5]
MLASLPKFSPVRKRTSRALWLVRLCTARVWLDFRGNKAEHDDMAAFTCARKHGSSTTCHMRPAATQPRCLYTQCDALADGLTGLATSHGMARSMGD